MERKSSKTLRHKIAVSEYLKFQSIQKKQETLDNISSNSTNLLPRPGEFLVFSNDINQSSKTMTLSDFSKSGLLRPNSSSLLRTNFYQESMDSRSSAGVILTNQLRNITRTQIPEMLTVSSMAMVSDDSREFKLRPSTGIARHIDWNQKKPQEREKEKEKEARPKSREDYFRGKNKATSMAVLPRPHTSLPQHPDKTRVVIKKEFNMKKQGEGEGFSITTPIEEFIQEAREELGRTDNTKFLPLEMYNPHADENSPQEFIEAIRKKHGEAVAYSKWFYPNGTYEWKKCRILGFDSRIDRFSIQWENGTKKHASRINIRLLEESEQIFDDRLNSAGLLRDQAEVIMKYIFLIQSMKNPTTPLPLKIIDCIINRIFSSKKISTKDVRVQLNFIKLSPGDQHNTKRMLWTAEFTHLVHEQPIYIRLGIPNLHEFKEYYFKNFKGAELKFMGSSSIVKSSSLQPLIKEVEEHFEFAQHKIEFEADMPYNTEKKDLFTGILPTEKFIPLGEREIVKPEKTIIYFGFMTTLAIIHENLHQSSSDYFNILYRQNAQMLEFRKYSLFMTYFPQPYTLTKFVRLQKMESLDTLSEFRNICFDTQYSVQDILNTANESRQKRNEEKSKARIYANQVITLEAKLPSAFLDKLLKFLKLCNHNLEREIRYCLETSISMLHSQLKTIKKELKFKGDFLDIIEYYRWNKKDKTIMRMKCYLVFDEGKASIQPGLKEIIAGFKDFLWDIVEEIKKTPSLELAEVGNSRDLGFMRIVEERDHKLNESINKCCRSIKKLWKYPEKSLSYLECIENLLQLDTEIVRTEISNNFTIEYIEDELFRLKEAKQIMDELFGGSTSLCLGLFAIKTKSAFELIKLKYSTVFEFFREILSNKIADEVALIEAQENETMKIIRHQPQNLEELDEIKKFLSVQLKESLEYLETHSRFCFDCINCLENSNMPVDADLLFRAWTSFGLAIRIDKAKGFCGVTIRKCEKEFAEQLKSSLAQIIIDIECIRSDFEVLKTSHDYERYEEISQSYGLLKDTMEKTSDFCKILNVREGIVGVPSTDFKHLDSIRREFSNYCKLWFYIRDFAYHEPMWMRGNLSDMDSDAVSAEVELYLNELKVMLNSTFKDDINALKLSLTLQKNVQRFSPYVPLLKNLKSTGMKDRHWESISKLTGIYITKSLQVNLKTIIEGGALDFDEEIEEITEGALREQNIESSKARMEKEWESISFQIEPYKDSKTYILVETSEIWEKLDEHLMKVISMCNSPHASFIEKEIAQWKNSLFKLQEILEEWEKLQKTWSYVYPIFTSEDIVNDLPVVAGRFSHVNTQWANIMNSVKLNPVVIEVCYNNPKIQEQIKYARDTLETILKSLYEYLNTKRKAFPRFYFLSNEELLSILSNSRELETSQKFINKCFEGINKIILDEEMITAMESPEQEIVQFASPISIKDSGVLKSVEVWMHGVELSMKSTLSSLLQNCFHAFSGSPDLSWLQSWPSQLVQTSLQLFWTICTETSLSEPSSMRSLSSQIASQLSSLVTSVREDIDANLLSTISTLTILTIHNKDTVSSLVEQRVRSSQDFYWQAELRYYSREARVQVKMVDTVKEYGCEYLGNQGRLVLTSLTDRCQRILMTAIRLCLGGAPEGPAGTGKTETTKDLAKALGKKCVVFNCSDSLDHNAMGKFFIGLCSCGAWACFDEFNRMEQEVLSVVAEQIAMIQAAMVKKAPKFLFDSELVPLDDSCAIFITMNPGYAGRSELPDNLKGLFRPIAMMVPDYAMIAEILLYSYGFHQSRMLARKLISSFKLASEQLSSQRHYDYGMRAVTTVIKKAGILNRSWQGSSEEELLLQAIKTSTLPKFLPDDLPLLNGILKDLFPEVTRHPEPSEISSFVDGAIYDLRLIHTPALAQKVVELYELLQVRHGNMLVGATMTGKSTALTILSKAIYLQRCKQEPGVFRKLLEVVRIWVNPKSLSLKQLYGEPEANTNDWKDGVLSSNIRNCAEGSEVLMNWVEMDGPVDALWIENLNTVLDDNKKLCLSSGEIVKLTSNIKLIFEVEDLEQASPATVSRCGMVYMQPDTLGWRTIRDRWLVNLPAGYAKKEIAEFMRQVFDYFTEPCLKFLKNVHCVVEMSPTWAISNVIYLLEALMLKSSLNIEEHNEMVRDVKTKIDVDRRSSFKKNSINFRDVVRRNLTRGTTRRLSKKQTIISEFVMDEGSVGSSEKAELFSFFLFALAWGMGGFLEEPGKKQFNDVIHKVYSNSLGKGTGAVALEASKKLGPIFHYDTYFTHFYNVENHNWESWNSLLLKLPREKSADLNFIVIPCTEIVSKMYLLTKLVPKGYHVLMAGVSGTGKSCSVNKLLADLDSSRFSNILSTLSAQSSCNMVQEVIESKLTKRKKNVYGAELGKKCLVVIDDLNMPTKELYGAQSAIEILRSAIDKRLWYDLESLEAKSLEDLIFLGLMANTGGRQSLSMRYMRHLFLITASEYSSESLETIYNSYLSIALDRHLAKVKDTITQITCATIDIYHKIVKSLPPTPAKSHYTFNLRDITRVFQGIAMVSSLKLDTAGKMYHLWMHECTRVFSDRLIGDDQLVFQGLLEKCMEKWVHMNLGEVAGGKEIIYCNFIGDKMYQHCPDMITARDALEIMMNEYNFHISPRLEMVFFDFAIVHLARICRIISASNGHVLLIGIGGSGRTSLCKMAAFLQEYSIFQIQVSNTYSVQEWREDIKSLLFKTGAQNSKQLLLLRDYELTKDIYFENVNNILNSGEIPNLFNQEEKESIIDKLREIRGMSIKTSAEKWEIFLQNTKKNLHIVFCFSPIGENLKKKLRQFPSFTNCCSINWMTDWPEDALRSVTEKCFKESGITHDVIKQKDMEDLCVTFHYSVLDSLQTYYKDTKGSNNITGTHYLNFLEYIRRLLENKKGELIKARRKYKHGVQKIDGTQVYVDKIRQDLIELKPNLVERTKETESIMKIIYTKNVEADKTRTMVSQEQKESATQAEAAAAIKQECEFKLNKAIPELEAATKALKTLKKDEINEVRNMQKPPYGVKLAVEAVVIINREKPIRVADPQDKSRTTLDYFEAGKKMMKDSNFIKKLQRFDKDALAQETIDKLLPYIENPKFQPEMVRKASVAAEGLCKWVRAMFNFYYVNKDVKPKKESLRIAKETMAVKMKLLHDKEAELREVEEKIFELKTQYEANNQDRLKLVADIKKCEIHLARAVKLIEKLAGEKERWGKIVVKMKEDMKNLLGDMILAAGMMAYMGNFIGGYREKILQGSWIPAILASRTITCTKEFLLKNALSNELQVQNWHLQNLPTDKGSIENAIIISHSFKWPLLVDPQSQAFKWISKMKLQDKSQLVMIKPGFEEFYAVVENALFLGHSLWIENIAETLDPVLIPLLNKDIHKQQGLTMVKLGDNFKQIDPKFQLYMSTTVSSPNFSPETASKVNIINFSITKEGLTEQLLAIVCKKMLPKETEEKYKLAVNSFSYIKKLQDFEDSILEMLQFSGENILDDEVLINSLTESKSLSEETGIKLEKAVAAEQKIVELQAGYIPMASLSAELYFAVSDMQNIDPMYVFSMEWFLIIFNRSIGKPLTLKAAANPVELLTKAFRLELYTSITMCLFEKHKLLFSFLIASRLSPHWKYHQWRYFLTGIASNKDLDENPIKDSISDKSWAAISELSLIPELSSLQSHVVSCKILWKKYIESSHKFEETPEFDVFSQEIPGPYNACSMLERLLLIKALRPEDLTKAIQSFVKTVLGSQYLAAQLFSMKQVYQESDPNMPMIFILTPGNDPENVVQRFAHELGSNFQSIALGKGQGERAARYLREYANTGGWVLLQNCHLLPSWMPELENIVQRFRSESEKGAMRIHGGFRICLTTKSTPRFPITILQHSVKVVNEPATGLKNNLKAVFQQMGASREGQEFFSQSAKPEEWQRLLFGLCFFHCQVLERQKFGPLGWNVQYEFSAGDLKVSQRQLKILVEKYPSPPYEAMQYLTGECNYGGRVTESFDKTTLNSLLSEVYRDDVMYPHYRLCSLQAYRLPDCPATIADVIAVIDTYPSEESPGVFGLHQNANIAYSTEEAHCLLESLMKIEVSYVISVGKDKMELFKIIDEIFDLILPEFSIELVKAKYPLLYEESLNTFLQQEVQKFNNLLRVVKQSILKLKKALDGVIVISPELEKLAEGISTNQVPEMWAKYSYISEKPLMSWVKDLNARLVFFSDWINNGYPDRYWFSGLFFPQSFLTSLLQNYARKNKIAIDTLQFAIEILGEGTKEAIETGCLIYGLFIEGARWDPNTKALEEAFDSVLYSPMPIFWLQPLEKTYQTPRKSKVYYCPVYRTTKRVGILSTAGHSTNYIMTMPIQSSLDENHWIKRGVAILTQLND